MVPPGRRWVGAWGGCLGCVVSRGRMCSAGAGQESARPSSGSAAHGQLKCPPLALQHGHPKAQNLWGQWHPRSAGRMGGTWELGRGQARWAWPPRARAPQMMGVVKVRWGVARGGPTASGRGTPVVVRVGGVAMAWWVWPGAGPQPMGVATRWRLAVGGRGRAWWAWPGTRLLPGAGETRASEARSGLLRAQGRAGRLVCVCVGRPRASITGCCPVTGGHDCPPPPQSPSTASRR